MFAIINNIPEPTFVPGSALAPGDVVELSGSHGRVVADGTAIYFYEANATAPIDQTSQYAKISATVTINPA